MREAAEHFCPWYSKAPRSGRYQFIQQRGRRGMGKDEILAARFAHQTGVIFVVAHIGPDLFQMLLKTRVEPVKVNTGKFGVVQNLVGHDGRGAGQEVDDAIGQAGRL
jgi:hypothetical protein